MDTGLRSVRLARVGDELVLSTTENDLFQPFYALLQDVGDRVQLDGAAPLVAIDAALRSWRRLLAGLAGMSREQQIGLTGELWALARLIRGSGPHMIRAWTGPAGEAHDFRIESTELEVKTTSGQRRQHRVSSIDQLAPSPERELMVLSIQVARAGAGEGWKLTDQVRDIRGLLVAHEDARARFDELLAGLEWTDDDGTLYPERWCLRTDPVLIRVDHAFPRITGKGLDDMLGSIRSRIDDISYRIDLTGLGDPDPSPGFLAILPASPQHDTRQPVADSRGDL